MGQSPKRKVVIQRKRRNNRSATRRGAVSPVWDISQVIVTSTVDQLKSDHRSRIEAQTEVQRRKVTPPPTKRKRQRHFSGSARVTRARSRLPGHVDPETESAHVAQLGNSNRGNESTNDPTQVQTELCSEVAVDSNFKIKLEDEGEGTMMDTTQFGAIYHTDGNLGDMKPFGGHIAENTMNIKPFGAHPGTIGETIRPVPIYREHSHNGVEVFGNVFVPLGDTVAPHGTTPDNSTLPMIAPGPHRNHTADQPRPLASDHHYTDGDSLAPCWSQYEGLAAALVQSYHAALRRRQGVLLPKQPIWRRSYGQLLGMGNLHDREEHFIVKAWLLTNEFEHETYEEPFLYDPVRRLGCTDTNLGQPLVELNRQDDNVRTNHPATIVKSQGACHDANKSDDSSVEILAIKPPRGNLANTVQLRKPVLGTTPNPTQTGLPEGVIDFPGGNYNLGGTFEASRQFTVEPEPTIMRPAPVVPTAPGPLTPSIGGFNSWEHHPSSPLAEKALWYIWHQRNCTIPDCKHQWF